MMQFKPTGNYNSNGRPKKDFLVMFRKWYAVALLPVILGIHVGIIPIWLAVVPKFIIILMAAFIILGLYQFIFTKKIFGRNLSKHKIQMIDKFDILEIFGYSALSACLFYVGWMDIFYLYSSSVIAVTSLYIFLLIKQYDQIHKNKG